MNFLLLIYGKESDWTDEARRSCMAKSQVINDELVAQGKLVATAPLQSVTTAATVRLRNDRPLVTDGPFAETKEQLGGFYLLDVADVDEAIAIASRLPAVSKGTVEIRELFALIDLPPARPLPAGSSSSESAGMPFMLLCYDDEAAWRADGAAQQVATAEAFALTRRLSEAGQYLRASGLRPAATAKCVSVRAGKREISDGPFTETKEVLGGFYLILAHSQSEALRIAAQHPGLRHGAVEVRRLFDEYGLRKSDSRS
jgi:hypothetical protein